MPKARKKATKVLPGHQFDVVVSGGGPVALASALEAVKSGKKVAVLSDRDIELKTKKSTEQAMAFSRGQRIHLDNESRYYLLSLFPKDFYDYPGKYPEDAKFLHLIQKDITVKLRHIERFLFRRLQENHPEVTFFNKTEIKSIDMSKGKLWIGSANEKKQSKPDPCISFKNVIAADGAKHHAVNVLNSSKNRPPITYNKIVSSRHEYHASFTFNIRRKDGEEIIIKSQFFEALAHISGDRNYLAGISVNKKKKDYKTVKCVFGSEIPKDLYDKIEAMKEGKRPEAEVKNAIKEHLGKIMAKEFNLSPNALDIDFPEPYRKKKKLEAKSEVRKAYHATKSKLAIQTFKTDLVKANKAYYEENKNKFLIAGDAFRRPNYQYGHGLNNGVMHARNIGKLLKGQYDCKKYDEECKSLSVKIEWNNRFLNALRGWGNKILLRGGNKKPQKVISVFGYILNPDIANIIQPLRQHIEGTYFKRNKSSAKKLLTQIFQSDQKINTVKNILHKELEKENKKWLPSSGYQNSLKKACALVDEKSESRMRKRTISIDSRITKSKPMTHHHAGLKFFSSKEVTTSRPIRTPSPK